MDNCKGPTFHCHPDKLSATSIAFSGLIGGRPLRCYGVPVDFLELAVKLLLCPALSASIERIFSSFENIHTKSKMHNEIYFKLLSKDTIIEMCFMTYTRMSTIGL